MTNVIILTEKTKKHWAYLSFITFAHFLFLGGGGGGWGGLQFLLGTLWYFWLWLHIHYCSTSHWFVCSQAVAVLSRNDSREAGGGAWASLLEEAVWCAVVDLMQWMIRYIFDLMFLWPAPFHHILRCMIATNLTAHATLESQEGQRGRGTLSKQSTIRPLLHSCTVIDMGVSVCHLSFPLLSWAHRWQTYPLLSINH